MSLYQNINTTQQKLYNSELSCVELVNDYLERIKAGKSLNSYITVLQAYARAQANEIDKKIKARRAGKLAGCIIAIKDILALEGHLLSCGSKILDNFISPYDATVVERLEKEDAIIIGKTNMDEFAMGSSNENSAFGAVKNPHGENHVPGGSSGGSAVAVAANLAMASLGTDTGGSIRQPAAFTGVVGMKPTYGRVSRWGLVAFASSLDQIGPFTHSVDDAARILEVISGDDSRDSTSAQVPVPCYTDFLTNDIKGKTIGLPKEYLASGVQKEILDAVEVAKKLLQKGGAKIKEVSLPHTEHAIATYYIICTAEASSNLARYDGLRYGRRAEDVHSLEELYVKSRNEGLGPEVKRRIMLGTYVLSSGYYDAYYHRAMQVRTLIRRDFDNVFKECDALLTPTTPTTAFKLGEKADDPLTMYLNDIFTVSMNLAGIPGISIPAGKDDKKLPIGIQLIAKPFDESTLLQLSHYLETEGINA